MRKPARKKPASTLPESTQTILIPDPLIVRLFMTEGDIWGDLRHGLLTAKKIPSPIRAKREAKIERLKKIAPEQAAKTWHGGEREQVLTALRSGEVELLLRWLQRYGQRGLWHALNESDILELMENLWISWAVFGDKTAQQKLQAILTASITPRLTGRQTSYSDEEAQQRKKEQDRKAKRSFAARISVAFRALQEEFRQQTRRRLSEMKQASQQDRRQVVQMIAEHIVDQACASKRAVQQHAAKDFLTWLAGGGVHVHAHEKKK
jgi:hypothetical protein